VALPDMRRRVFWVVALLALTRVIAAIPLPGINLDQLASFLEQNQALSLLNLFTGGGLSNLSLALLGVGPYITASIIFQLLSYTIPSLEQLQKEGEMGRRKINQYTRIATVPLAFLQSYGTLTLLRNSGAITAWNPSTLLLMLLVSTAGSMLLMWLGELISEHNLGNGMSLIITLGIVANVNTSIFNTASAIQVGGAALTNIGILGLIGLLTLAAVIMVNEGVRQIPISYARNLRTRGLLGRVDSTLPVKINTAGVVPIIFAVSLVLFPSVVAQFLKVSSNASLVKAGEWITTVFDQNSWTYMIIYFLLVCLFTFFYTFILIKPDEMAENLQRQSGFIPGVRPGQETATHITTIISRLTFPGAIFLGLIAVLPTVIQKISHITTLSVGGTSVLIVVSVVLETIRQVQAQIATRTYDTA
jgi:preprotein translocase subunit SecY